ncbi:interleukin-21 receptor [Chelmon rostratus]|uniref:interleukin-21 receptor n=1 Tax=Chelmon rostratus TaxID=109905 RepID=UPI001BEC7633|nr:interleukin-21 receptor [Chelmon rostratus]
MSGPPARMDRCSPPGLKLVFLFLLASTNTVCLHPHPNSDADHKLRCENDYLFTINCSLRIPPPEDTSDSIGSYWLTFTEAYLGRFTCMLTNTDGVYFCSVKTTDSAPDDDDYSEPFSDLDAFEISLCHNQSIGSESCELLDEEYRPVTNITPNAPCCLTVSHDSSQYHFTWASTYEEYSPFTALIDNLKYQLHYYKRGDNVTSPKMNTNRLNYSVGDRTFEPDTEYAARVRSSPNQAFYKGQWSDWSSEVHWRTESAVNGIPLNTFVSGLGKVFIPLCVMVLLVLLLCYAPVKKWRKSAFIPTPAPYFHTLYSDCQGDFKSWVVTQEKTTDMLKAEETLRIDMLTKCADIQEVKCQTLFHHQSMEGSTYKNIADPVHDSSLLGIPYAVRTMAPPTAPGSSLEGPTLSSEPGSPAEGDSGCWLCSHTSLERDPPFYCNEYCTLSAFQQAGPVTAEHHRGQSTKSCPTGMITVEAVPEA